jgi:hypothetical protein
MMDWITRADDLLAEYSLICKARAKDNTVDIQLDKELCAKWANYLTTQRNWGSELEIAEACQQLEPRLERLKEKVIIEILGNGTF